MVGIGTVPAVDGLIGVSHRAQIGPAAQPCGQQIELEGVHVLELVDVEVPEAPPLGIGESTISGQGVTALVQQVVEVDQVTVGLLLFVLAVDPGHGGGGQRWRPAGRLGRRGVGLGPDATGLGPFDLSHHVERSGGPVVARKERPDHSHLAVEQLGLAAVVLAPPGAELGEGH